MLSESRERFLQDVLARIPLERLVEVHLFPAIRQGQLETGVAVVAALREPLAKVDDAQAPVVDADTPVIDAHAPVVDAHAPVVDAHAPAVVDDRLVVYSAWYRHTRKGVDRGKWEVDVTLEADAPFATVDAVVRGVQERAGEAIDPQRLTHADLEALIAEPTWQLTSA